MDNTTYQDPLQAQSAGPQTEQAAPPEPEETLPKASFWERLTNRRERRRANNRRARIKRLNSLPNFAETVEPAMARLTDELIAETVGDNGILIREFRAQLSKYDPDKNPIGPNEARALMMSMLDLAASRRKLLNERLERSVEVGSLYKSYYGRVQAVNTLAIDAYTDLVRKDFAEEDFLYHYGIFMNVRDTAVIDKMRPKDKILQRIEELREKMNTRDPDIMQELDKRGGG